MEASITEKAMRGIERFLERRGMEIIEHGWAHGKDKVDFIAEDEGALVFISCNIRTNDGNGIADEEPNRKKFERIASAYLAEHLDLPESAIRHDIVSMLIRLIGQKVCLKLIHRVGISGLMMELAPGKSVTPFNRISII